MESILVKTLMALAMGFMIAGSSDGLAADVKAKSCPLKNKATSTKAVGATPKNAKDTENVSYLFVLQAQQGTLTKNKDGQWILTLKHKDVNNVIEFSDRPFRIVKYISTTDLKELWPLGTNSYEVDPPNAVLTAKGHKAQIIVLREMTVNNQSVSFEVHLTNTRMGTLKNGSLESISLVVDTVVLSAGESSCFKGGSRITCKSAAVCPAGCSRCSGGTYDCSAGYCFSP